MATSTIQRTPQASAPRRAGGIALIIFGAIAALTALGLLAGGGILMTADRTMRDASGYLSSPSTRLTASSYAIAATDVSVAIDSPTWHVSSDALGSVRLTASSGSGAVFIGIAPRSDVLRYLDGVAYDQLTGSAASSNGATYQLHGGGAPVLPSSLSIWRDQASGPGSQSVTWKVQTGEWAVVLMNADASRGVAADVSVGATAPFLFALAVGLIIGGGVAALIAALLLFGGISVIRRSDNRPPAASEGIPPSSPALAPPPPPPGLPYPLRLEAQLDAAPSRWLWLVKWILLIPHYIVLGLLVAAAAILTVVAFFAILVTGRYPRPIFNFNVAVLQWWWRVSFYGYSALGTDSYPPFTLHAPAGYPATLEVPYPERLSRGLVLVKWVLAIPHYLIVAALVGGATIATSGAGPAYASPYGGLITLLAVIAAVTVLVTTRYPRGIFDLVMGLNRWVYRVLVYAMLLRDEYPPFRLDMGGQETGGSTAAPLPAPPPAPLRPRPAHAT
jgi:hypothetical protein